ncbi:helix-turn-helix domain-containing protein [Kribbella endophytica]
MASDDDRIRDIEPLRAFANPLRLRLYYALTAEGVATATRLAAIVEQPSSLVSYHLHKLAEYGFIEEAEGHSSDGRERWWRKVRALTWQPTDFTGQPAERAVSASLRHALANHQSTRLRQYLDEEDRDVWPREWAAAAFSSDTLLQLTPSEMADFETALQEVVIRFAKLRDNQSDTGQSARAERVESASGEDGSPAERTPVMFFMHAFPFRP